MTVEDKVVNNLSNIIILAILLGALLFVMTKYGGLQCDTVPGWCSIYYAVAGSPRVLLVTGDDGLGQHALLREGLSTHTQVFAEALPISAVGSQDLQSYSLVIVDGAKNISTDSLQAFGKFVDQGGRLVWIGDAGTEADNPEDFWYEDDEDANAMHIKSGAWIRKDSDGFKYDFGKNYLSANYLGNFCELNEIECETQNPRVGTVFFSSDPLVQGIKRNFVLERNFAMVTKLEAPGGTSVVSGITTYAAVVTDDKNYGNDFPLILRTGAGKRVAYYAFAPEEYLDASKGSVAPSFIQNLIDEMRP